MGSTILLTSHKYTHIAMKLVFSSLFLLGGALGEVVKLNSGNFEAKVGEKDLALVKFFAPWCGHCQSMAQDWADASGAVGENAMIADVDCTEERDLCQKYDVGGYPTLMAFKGGKMHEEFYDRTKSSILAYVKRNGGAAGGDDLGDAYKFDGKSEPEPESYPVGEIVKVVGSTFDAIVLDETADVLLKIYAPWCGHCKNMQPAYADLANKLAEDEDIVIAEIDATANDLPPTYQVRGYPTIFWAGKGNKDAPEKYQGARTVDAWMKFIKSKTSKKDEL